jgi:hypothetical protein
MLSTATAPSCDHAWAAELHQEAPDPAPEVRHRLHLRAMRVFRVRRIARRAPPLSLGEKRFLDWVAAAAVARYMETAR